MFLDVNIGGQKGPNTDESMVRCQASILDWGEIRRIVCILDWGEIRRSVWSVQA